MVKRKNTKVQTTIYKTYIKTKDQVTRTLPITGVNRGVNSGAPEE